MATVGNLEGDTGSVGGSGVSEARAASDSGDGAPRISRGRYSALPSDLDCNIDLHVGRFCSIAGGLTIVSGQHPPVDNPEVVSTFPFREWNFGDYPPCRMSGAVVVGHDVWIGQGVTLMDGAYIGSGSIVAAGSVVPAGDYPPYSVIAGNPGIFRRFRFPVEKVRRLGNIAWWNWSDDEIKAALPYMADIDLFLEKFGGKEKTS